ncbi:MAG TPA: serine/threonine-protein kinase [Candidatus Xenobia bacterium]|jgi:serine/threonine-protein kinase
MLHFRGTLVHQRYEVEGQIGAGASGCVYRAIDKQTSETVALKHLKQDDKEVDHEKKFLQESHLLQELTHPGIPRMVEAFTEPDGFYVAMEFIEGTSLDNVVRQEGTFNPARVLACAGQICDILTYLHGQPQPVLHRDIKPQNIIQRPDGQGIVLVDFGIARSMSAHRHSAAGTLGYAPLEQIQGRAERRSDLYALGITMYYLLVGNTPQLFGSTPSLETAMRGRIQPEVAFIVNMACQQQPTQRYQSAERMATAIRRAQKTLESGPAEAPAAVPTSEEKPAEPAKAGCLHLILPPLLLLYWLHH